MGKEFEGKTALVTGGGSGIGRASALALAAQGATVTVTGRTAARLEETVQLIRDNGGAARFIVGDVQDEEVAKAAVAAAVGDTGRLDVAVNNAGYDGEYQLTVDYDMELFDTMSATNIRGVLVFMKHELRQMVAQGFGSIVNMSSGAALIGIPGYSGYTATKAAEIAMTKSSALEVAPLGIRINALCPGLVETPMIASMDPTTEPMKSLLAQHPMGRIAQPEEIADAVVWLSSDHARFITGVALPIDGGISAK